MIEIDLAECQMVGGLGQNQMAKPPKIVHLRRRKLPEAKAVAVDPNPASAALVIRVFLQDDRTPVAGPQLAEEREILADSVEEMQNRFSRRLHVQL